VDDPSARQLGEPRAVVAGAVVGDDHLARDLAVLERAQRRGDALRDVLRLVQARDDDRDERGGVRLLGAAAAVLGGKRGHGDAR
jgi:hypothetical protein